MTQVTAVGLVGVVAATMKWLPAALAQRQKICLHKVELLLQSCLGVAGTC